MEWLSFRALLTIFHTEITQHADKTIIFKQVILQVGIYESSTTSNQVIDHSSLPLGSIEPSLMRSTFSEETNLPIITNF
ncbi:MAG: hypothetical protein ACI9YO_003290 [Gammaproteobacteria bacterium]|jgi:hypothetical protein